MTKEEFELKEKEWLRRLDNIMEEMHEFKNHKGFKVILRNPPPARRWFLVSMDTMRNSFNSDARYEGDYVFPARKDD